MLSSSEPDMRRPCETCGVPTDGALCSKCEEQVTRDAEEQARLDRMDEEQEAFYSWLWTVESIPEAE